MSFVNVFGGTVVYPSDVSLVAYELDDDITLNWPLDAQNGPDVAARIIELTTTGSGFTVTLPPANETGVGQTILFNNLGPDDVDILDSAGATVLSTSSGEQWQIYLTDNATAAGTWRTFRYGAATAQAQAAALAGEGLVAVGSYLAQATTTATVSSTPYTMTGSDRAAFYVWTGALGTLNLPAAASVGNNWFVNVRNGGTGNWTIDPSGTETINDETTITLQPGDSAVLVTNGAEWWTIGLGKQAIFAFDYTTIDVDGLSGTYTLSGSELNRISYKFTGALAGDLDVVVPATLQQYWIDNETTGGFVFALKASGGATETNVDEGTRGIYYCNGTEVIKADTTSGVPLPLAVADGGTASTSAAGARTNLSAAKSGANSDITSLSGLTTPLSVAQGGTGSATASGARTNLGTAAAGANSDITALSAIADGTVSAPSIANTGDSDTGIYFPAANTVAAAAGGEASLYFGAGGTSTILGYDAGNLSAAYNIFVGYQAAKLATGSATGNTIIGYQSCYGLAGVSGNTVVGYNGGTEDGNYCTIIGAEAASNGTAEYNTVVGYQASAQALSGAGATGCTVIGAGASLGSPGGGTNNTVIGRSASIGGTASNSTAVGYQATSGSNQVTLGNSSISALRCQVTSITSISDGRDKTDVRVLPAGMDLEFVNALRPVAFTWNMRDGGKVGIPDIGFIAQELLEAQERCGVKVPNLVLEADPDRLEAAYGVLVPILTRAIQQLTEMLDCEKAERKRLEERVEALEQYVF